MKGWSAIGSGARAALLGAGTVAAAGGGWLIWNGNRAPEPAVPPAALVSAVPEKPQAAPEPEADPVAAEVAQPRAPRIGTWAVAADGSATIAGTAEPRALVRVLLAGEALAETRATRHGEFALVTTIPPDPAPRLLTLEMELEDGRRIAGDEVVAIGPVAGPQAPAVAEVAPETPEAETVEVVAQPAPEAAPEPPAALIISAEGARVAQGDTAPSGTLGIETISYTERGAVVLAGTGAAASWLRLYLDGSMLRELRIPEDGRWRVVLEGVAPGLYTLRADQVDAAGKVTARFETPFRRETLETLAMAGKLEEPVAEAPAPEPLPAAAAPAAPPSAEPAAVASPVVEAPVLAEPVAPAISEAVPAPAEAAPARVAEAAPSAEAAPVPQAEPAPAPAPAAEPAPTAPALVTVTVQPGHTLWSIARGELGEGVRYVQVWEANKDRIRNPDLIYPGQVFTIPAEQ